MIDPAHTAPSISRPIRKPVGITKGPGESTHEYTFVSRDDAQELKNGEYVYYELADPDGALTQPRRVLGRVMKRVPLKLYPDSFLAEPEIAPSQVAAMVGYDSRANELFELHVAIMGYYDAPSASFINPWIPPQSGKQIFLADAQAGCSADCAFGQRRGQHAHGDYCQHRRGEKLSCQRSHRRVDAAP